jgi:hypothetical protein
MNKEMPVDEQIFGETFTLLLAKEQHRMHALSRPSTDFELEFV